MALDNFFWGGAQNIVHFCVVFFSNIIKLRSVKNKFFLNTFDLSSLCILNSLLTRKGLPNTKLSEEVHRQNPRDF